MLLLPHHTLLYGNKGKGIKLDVAPDSAKKVKEVCRDIEEKNRNQEKNRKAVAFQRELVEKSWKFANKNLYEKVSKNKIRRKKYY